MMVIEEQYISELDNLFSDGLKKAYPHNYIEKTTNKFLNTSVRNCYLRHINAILNTLNHKRFSKSSLKGLDWGCGTGYQGSLLSQNKLEIFHCDVPNALNKDQEFIGNLAKYKLLDHEYKLPYNDCSFDFVVSFGVLEHVPNEVESLKEINRILKPGGVFFVFMLPRSFSYIQRIAHLRGDFYHDRLYTKKIIRSMFKSSGFTVNNIIDAQIIPRSRFAFDEKVEIVDRFLSRYLSFLCSNYEFCSYKK